MKTNNVMNVERHAAHAIERFLEPLPNFVIDRIDREGVPGLRDTGIDILVTGRFDDKPLLIVAEVKSSGQPRNVRDAAHQLHRYLREQHDTAIPIVVAPYLSPQARHACREERVGYLDFLGNALIAFDTIYIEREVADRPEPERRALRSLYKPKSARILRALLGSPGRGWRTADLAETAKVSAGLVSQVGTKLRENGWAEQTDQGIVLIEPDALLDSWAEQYEPPRGEEHRCYTSLHGDALTDKLREITTEQGRVALASYSAAEWLAPFARHPNTYFYADEDGFEAIKRLLNFRPAPRGANIVVVVLEEDGVLDDAQIVSNGLVATSPVQTYLDLVHAGDRGEEGAAHLRIQLLDWQ